MSGKRRLLSISTLYPNAAQPRFGSFVANSLQALAARGDWEVTLINPIGTPPVAVGRYRAIADAAVDGVERGVAVYRPRFTLLPLVGGRLNPGAIHRSALPLAMRLHAKERFDLVDAQFFYPDGPAAARIAAALDLPLSIKARGSDISYWTKKPYARERMVAAANAAAGVLAVSRALAGDMAQHGIPADRITVHYTGLDRSLFKPIDRQTARADLTDVLGLSLPVDSPLIASVGALIPRKGQALVLQSLIELPDVHLALIGQGPDQQQLEALAADLGIASRCHFLGSLDHRLLPVILSASNAMVLPSQSEGLANAWVEALACGTPVVITDAGGAKEVVTDPTAGRIVQPEPQAIASALREVLANPCRQAKVAANAARFSWETHAAALADYYDSLLRRGNAG